MLQATWCLPIAACCVLIAVCCLLFVVSSVECVFVLVGVCLSVCRCLPLLLVVFADCCSLVNVCCLLCSVRWLTFAL